MDTVGQTVAILFLFALLALIGVLLRYMRYKETLALIEKGHFIAESPQKQNRNMLRWGIILTFVSIPWSLVFIALSVMSGSPTYINNLIAPGIFLGLMPCAFGLALICISRLEHKDAIRSRVRELEEEEGASRWPPLRSSSDLEDQANHLRD